MAVGHVAAASSTHHLPRRRRSTSASSLPRRPIRGRRAEIYGGRGRSSVSRPRFHTAPLHRLHTHRDRAEFVLSRASGKFTHGVHRDNAEPPGPGWVLPPPAPVQARGALARGRRGGAAPGRCRQHQLLRASVAREAEQHGQAAPADAGASAKRGGGGEDGLQRGCSSARNHLQAEPRRGGRGGPSRTAGRGEQQEGEEEAEEGEEDEDDGGGEEPEEAARPEDGPGEEGGDEGGGRGEGGGGGARVRGDAAEGARGGVDGHGQPRLEADEDPTRALLRAERPPLQDHAAHQGDLCGAREPGEGTGERADRRRGRGGHEHASAAAPAPPRRRPGSQEQAHQAQPPAGAVRDQQVLPGHGQRREVRRAVPGGGQRPHHGHRPLRAQARLPHLHLRPLLDPPLRRPSHDALQLHPLPLRHGIGEAGDLQGSGGAGVRAREGADGGGGDGEGRLVPGEVPRRDADDEADLLAPLPEPRDAKGAHQRGHGRRRRRGGHPQAQPTPPPRHRRPPRLSEAQGERGDQAEVRAGREGEAHPERDRRQPEDLEGDGSQVRAQGTHEAQAPHPRRLPPQIHVKLNSN